MAGEFRPLEILFSVQALLDLTGLPSLRAGSYMNECLVDAGISQVYIFSLERSALSRITRAVPCAGVKFNIMHVVR